uniref:Dual serine/threonine and tyrosine protein kinase n=1 Tax=Geotrypetes seraphini TaxID=260995 RepID=A0A6P8PET7_GEOSA|nr:dual serine/threonine and tyrosine protein kinase isoform X2 [Geotrypetes seraphini]
MEGGGGGALSRELSRVFSRYNKYLGRLQHNVCETHSFLRDVRLTYSQGAPGPDPPGQQCCISIPCHEEEYLKLMVNHCYPCIIILGQTCNVRCQVLNTLLGSRLLPTNKHTSEENCSRRRIHFKHGKQTQVSLALPQQYELVHLMAANQGHWDTIPEEDLEFHEDEDEDPGHRLAELEVTLPHSLLQEVDIVVAPCRGFQTAEETLHSYLPQVQPIVMFAICKDKLSEGDENELKGIQEKFSSLPIFFLKVPSFDMELIAPREPESERSLLYYQLQDLGYLKSSSVASVPGGEPCSLLVEQFEQLRRLYLFSKQVLQQRLVSEAAALNRIHCQWLDVFINQAFDMQRDLQITPKRLEYTRSKENELFESLMSIADIKQEEMKEMIVETLNSMKEELLEDAATMEFKDIFIPENGEPISTRDIKCCIKQIQDLIISHLNQAVANKLINSMDYLRESFVGTLERCLESLEKSQLESSVHMTSNHLKQLEVGHSWRLEKTEDLWLKVRKEHAPRLARLSLESRSLQDALLHGKPKLGRELGRGQYGVVYLCDEWGGHFPCALKSVVPPDEKHWNDLALEFHYMRSLPKHERLVDLHGSVIDYSYGGGSNIAVLLIMERLHRDLYTALKAELALEVRLQIALDVVEGIRFLHSQGLVHRDIKLKNVLLDENIRAKITDLGFCKPEAMMSGSIVGTPIHMAPELFTGKYDNSVDVYAFGILFWYICSGSVRLPEAFERCSSKDHLWNNVKKGVRPEKLDVFDEECWELMKACWNGDPPQRPLLGIVQPILQGIKERLCKSDAKHLNKGLDDST